MRSPIDLPAQTRAAETAVPKTWTWSFEFKGRYLVITSPNVGAVTVDFQERGFRGGMVWAGKMQNPDKFMGTLWRFRLIDAAVAWLKKIERTV